MPRFFTKGSLSKYLEEKLNDTYQKLQSLKIEFDDAVKTAYVKGTTQTSEGNVYDIKEEDYHACKMLQLKIEEQITDLNYSLEKAIRLWTEKQKDEFKQKTKAMGSEILSIRNQCRSEFSGHLMGLKYVKDHPTPEARRGYEHENESVLVQRTFYGVW